jgi:hypothetical protein
MVTVTVDTPVPGFGYHHRLMLDQEDHDPRELAPEDLAVLRDRIGEVREPNWASDATHAAAVAEQLGELAARLLQWNTALLFDQLVHSRAAQREDDTPSETRIQRELPGSDPFDDVEFRGLLKILGLSAVEYHNIITVFGTVPDAETGQPQGWAHSYGVHTGEGRLVALRAAFLEFFEHELDHSLYLDGEPISDPHADDDGGL